MLSVSSSGDAMLAFWSVSNTPTRQILPNALGAMQGCPRVRVRWGLTVLSGFRHGREVRFFRSVDARDLMKPPDRGAITDER
jgi:hypothetical protein